MKREEKRQQKLDAILRHAAKAFMEKGYYKTSLDDIAKMHNVTKPTLYYYIKNKEDILVKCEEVAAEKINGLLDRVMEAGGTGYAQLYAFIKDYITLLNDDIIRCHVRHRGQRENDAARDASLKMHRGIESRVRAIIARGVEDGSIRRDAHPVINAILLFDALNGITAWYREDGALDMEALTEQILTLVAKGIEA